MTATLQVLYPTTEGTKFDYEYYKTSHYKIIHDEIGSYIESDEVVKGLAGGPDVPAPFYAVYTARFKDMETLQAAVDAAGNVLADIPNYTDTAPVMLIGEHL